jgi:hypothetical protein
MRVFSSAVGEASESVEVAAGAVAADDLGEDAATRRWLEETGHSHC